MKMDLSLSSKLELKITQGLRLAQTIDFCHLMTVPDEVISTIAGAVSFNPDVIEAKLQEAKSTALPPDTSGKVQNLYASLIPSKGDQEGKPKQGLIIGPDVRVLEGCIGHYQATVTPDVTYIGRTNQAPELVFSDHLRGSMNLLMLQIDASRHPETARMMAQLKRFDEWKRETLREAYVVVGGVQREFLEMFDKRRLNRFDQGDLAQRLDLHISTVSRILSNRWVEARDTAGNQQAMYTKDLLVTADELKKHAVLPELNELLAEEFAKKEAYPDEKIVGRVPHIARRTLAKYRKEFGIPDHRDRNRAYKSGELTEAYKLG